MLVTSIYIACCRVNTLAFLRNSELLSRHSLPISDLSGELPLGLTNSPTRYIKMVPILNVGFH